jgi:hypothetical protein
VWWHIPVIETLRRLGKEDLEFKVSLGYIVRYYLKNGRGRVGKGPGLVVHVYSYFGGRHRRITV